jgi:hypothetical protein
MKRYYECHITMLAADQGNPLDMRLSRERIAQLVGPEGIRWIFSAIDGDSVLGDGVKVYATKHFNADSKLADVQQDLEVAADYLQLRNCIVVRKKIEVVEYDAIKGRDF